LLLLLLLVCMWRGIERPFCFGLAQHSPPSTCAANTSGYPQLLLTDDYKQGPTQYTSSQGQCCPSSAATAVAGGAATHYSTTISSRQHH
jgi:hypothetical protein